MKTIPLLTAFILTGLGLAHPAMAADVPLASCPPAVQETIRQHAAKGKLDDVKKITVGGRTLYVAEVDLANQRDLKIHVSGDGALLKTREEITLAESPLPVREAAEKLVPTGGRVDDVDREVTAGKVAFLVEIKRPGKTDLKVTLAADGTILGQKEDTRD